jgi:DhnA family fructose-bisphosphate aldolase class Ia
MIVNMTLGKSLRLRRIFANGRALVVDCGPLAGDRLGKVRQLARAGADAVVLTPGLLDMVAEELASLSVILRIDGGLRRAQPLLSVQAALEMGAEAVLLSLEASGPGQSEAIELFGRVTEDARRLGMPVFAEVVGKDWLEVARLGAEYGADVIQACLAPECSGDHHFVRMTGRPFLASLGEEMAALPGLLNMVYDLMQGAAQGVVLGGSTLADPSMLRAIHGLVHQGISAAEALDIARSPERTL